MFNETYRAKVKNVELFAQTVDDQVFRRIRVRLEREFDGAMAQAMGAAGLAALEHLRNRGFGKVEIPIDAIQATATLTGPHGSIKVERVVGMKALAVSSKPGKNDDDEMTDEPSITFIFVMPFLEEPWVFFGKTKHDVIDVNMAKSQLSLDLPAAPKNGAPRNEEASNGHQVSVNSLKQSLKDASAAVPSTSKPKRGRGAKRTAQAAQASTANPQDARTPEEAERIRSQMIREEKMAEQSVWADGPDDDGDDDKDKDEDEDKDGNGDSNPSASTNGSGERPLAF